MSSPLLAPKVAAAYATPIAQRAHKGYFWVLKALLFGLLFDAGLLTINATQFLLLPIRVVPLPAFRTAYERGIQYTKGAFGTLVVLVCQWFAPTRFIITVEGSTSQYEFFDKDENGAVRGIKLPDKLVIMANHQVYTDWLYLWCLTYFARAHDQVLIILKKSLKHIPIVGWGMQFFRFLFLARSWSKDRAYLGEHLVQVAERAKSADSRLGLIIFPEGTLVSRDTRPLSKKYADKIGIPDLEHTLLPRSTGLLFLLRSMGPAIPDLQLLDVTIGYPGIPPKGYGQDYYTLRSIFFQGIPPPEIHIRLRLIELSSIPIGKVSAGDSVERGAEATAEEQAEFERWLVERWVEKDRLMDAFYRDGKFPSPKGVDTTPAVEIPIRLRSLVEVGNAFCFAAPVAVYYGCKTVAKWF